MSPKDLLSAVRQAQGWPSNYRLAREVGITDTTVHRWNTGANAPDDSTAARLAALAGLDPDAVVAHMQAHRTKEPADRARWQRIARRLESVAAAVVCVILSGLGMFPQDSQARVNPQDSAAVVVSAALDRSTHCAQFLRLAWGWFVNLWHPPRVATLAAGAP